MSGNFSFAHCSSFTNWKNFVFLIEVNLKILCSNNSVHFIELGPTFY